MWSLLLFAGLVGTLQGVAWLGGGRGDGDVSVRRGAVLAPMGLLALAVGLLGLLAPGFFTG